jgi:hypothetical protein
VWHRYCSPLILEGKKTLLNARSSYPLRSPSTLPRTVIRKVKGLVRRAVARTRKALIEAMGRALLYLSKFTSEIPNLPPGALLFGYREVGKSCAHRSQRSPMPTIKTRRSPWSSHDARLPAPPSQTRLFRRVGPIRLQDVETSVLVGRLKGGSVSWVSPAYSISPAQTPRSPFPHSPCISASTWAARLDSSESRAACPVCWRPCTRSQLEGTASR